MRIFFIVFLLSCSNLWAGTASKDTKTNVQEVVPAIKSQLVSSEVHKKVIDVNGMVCAFCASSIQKKFKKQEEVESLNIDLDKKKVTVIFKKGQTLSDSILKGLIESSGYTVIEAPKSKKTVASDEEI